MGFKPKGKSYTQKYDLFKKGIAFIFLEMERLAEGEIDFFSNWDISRGFLYVYIIYMYHW
jgi:hypothetical protein